MILIFFTDFEIRPGIIYKRGYKIETIMQKKHSKAIVNCIKSFKSLLDCFLACNFFYLLQMYFM
jgi:hypothetical protein